MMLPYNHSKSDLVFDKSLFNKFYDETPTDTQTNPNHPIHIQVYQNHTLTKNKKGHHIRHTHLTLLQIKLTTSSTTLLSLPLSFIIFSFSKYF